jgi:predicted TPR repeat methyltransferase
MVVALETRTDLSAGELRALARRETGPRASSRMYAIAHALEGLSRAEAARLSGMERQALDDSVVRLTMPRAWPVSMTDPRAAAGQC